MAGGLATAVAYRLVLSGAVLLLPLVCPVPGLAEPVAKPSPLFGYFDPQTHEFTPEPLRPGPSSGAHPFAAPIRRSGTIVIKATVALVSSIPAGATFNTAGSASLSDPPDLPPPAFHDSAADTTPSVARHGNTVTVVSSFSYNFVYASKSDQINVQFFISYFGSPSHSYIYRQAIPVPPDGAKTTIDLKASL